MKYKIIFKKENQHIFDGKVIDLPIKKDILKRKSIEMFGDEDPCIIHQTFVIETLIDQLISKFKKSINEDIVLSKDIKEIEFIDIKDIELMTMVLRRK